MEKRAAEIHQKFEKAKRKRQLKDPVWRELDAMDRGEQWSLDGGNIPAWVPKPVTNFIHLVKYTKRAALAIENPTGQLFPEGPDDVEMVKDLQTIYECLWDKMKARMTIREAIGIAKLLGTCIVEVRYHDDGTVKGPRGNRYEGELKWDLINPALFYPDPNAFSLEECDYVHIVKRKSIKWIKSHPLFKEKAQNLDDGRTVPYNERGEIFQRDYSIEQDKGIIDLHHHFERVPQEEGGFKYKVTYMAGETVLAEKDLKPNCYPFAVLYDFKQMQDFWGLSTCQIVMDNQKLINKVESIVALIGTLMQNPQKVVTKSSGINPSQVSKFGSAPGQTFQTNDRDASRSIYYVQPPQIPISLMNLSDIAKANIREVTGLTEAYMGQSVGSLQTSSGVDSLIERSTMRDRDQMTDIEQFIEDLTRLTLKFMAEYYTEERWFNITKDPNSQPEFLRFTGSDFKDLEYSFKINVSAKAPITRARRKAELEKLLNMQGQYGFDPQIITPQEYMKYSEFIDSERLIERMDRQQAMGVDQILGEAQNMFMEAVQGGVNPLEAVQAMSAMIEQRFEAKAQGTGSTSNSSNVQMRQAGTNV